MAKVIMKITGYYAVETEDGPSQKMINKANHLTQEEDFGKLSDIDWEVSSVEHDDGTVRYFL